MRRSVVLLLFLVAATANAQRYDPRAGDIVFHTSRSAQSMAVQRATGSRYSHMGLVFLRDGQPFVYEAVQPVKFTPLSDWVQRGKGQHFVVKRFRNAEQVLTPGNVRKLEREALKYRGRSYDLYFEWSDDRMYCSELVWKIYHRALGIRIGRLQHLREFNLSDPAVKAKMRERWPGTPPLDEVVVSPSAIFESPRLTTVYSQ